VRCAAGLGSRLVWTQKWVLGLEADSSEQFDRRHRDDVDR